MTTATKAGGAVLPVVAWRYRRLVDIHVTGAPRPGEVKIGQWWGSVGSWIPCNDPTQYSDRPGFQQEALTLHAPAQATIDELRAEVERLTRERDEAQESLSELADWLLEWRQKAKSLEHSLKAKQIDVEAVMRLVEVYAKASSELDESFRSRSRAPRMVTRHDLRVHVAFKAAREALRASLLGDGGTTAMASQEKPHD